MSDAPDDDGKHNGMMTAEELFTEAVKRLRSENEDIASPEILEFFSEQLQSLLENLSPRVAGGDREELIKAAASQIATQLQSPLFSTLASKIKAMGAENTAQIKARDAQIKAMGAENTAQIKARDAQIKARDAQINTMGAQINAMGAEKTDISAQLAARSLRWLLEKRGKFEYVDRTSSDPHVSTTTHAKAEMEVREVYLDQVSVPEKVWDAPYIPPLEVKKDIDSEAMVVAEVAKILEAILAGLGVSDRVKIALNRIIAGVELDIVFLLGSQRIPFAAIEVKKPGPEHFEDLFFSPDSEDKKAGYVQGQNLDQLNVLKLMGLKSAFGMITNGNTWMITGTAEWTLETKDDWDLNHLNEMMRECWDANKAVSSPEQTILEFKGNRTASSEDIPRKLFVSQHVSLPETEAVIKLVAMFIRLACNSISQPLFGKRNLNNLSCRVLNLKEKEGTKMRCSFQKLRLPKLDLTSCVDFANTKEIYLIHHLGSGGYGDCCLAVTKQGDQCCAVKFFLKQEGESTRHQLAAKELGNWNKVYGKNNLLPRCYLGYLPNDDGYICMPYFMPIPKAERLNRITDGSVENALRRFAESGFKHNEVYWRHFGWWNDDLYLLDLGGVTEFGPGDDKDEWATTSLQNLRARFSEPVSTPPVPNHPTFADQQQGGGHNSIDDHQQRGGGIPIASASYQLRKKRPLKAEQNRKKWGKNRSSTAV